MLWVGFKMIVSWSYHSLSKTVVILPLSALVIIRPVTRWDALQNCSLSLEKCVDIV